MDGIGQDRLELRKVPVPEPRLGEVLVKVGAVSLNDRDKMVIESGRGLPLDLPSRRFQTWRELLWRPPAATGEEVLTGSASDPMDWQTHIRSKQRREALAERFRKPSVNFCIPSNRSQPGILGQRTRSPKAALF